MQAGDLVRVKSDTPKPHRHYPSCNITLLEGEIFQLNNKDLEINYPKQDYPMIVLDKVAIEPLPPDIQCARIKNTSKKHTFLIWDGVCLWDETIIELKGEGILPGIKKFFHPKVKHRFINEHDIQIIDRKNTPIIKQDRHVCNCDMVTLMRYGCRCGGM